MSLDYRGITFKYRASQHPILKEFSWQVSPGKTVLLGPNGAGKSTLLAIGADAIRPKVGEVRCGSLSPKQRSQQAAYRRAVGWMPQQIRAVPGLTAQEQVAYAAWLKGIGRDEAWKNAARALAWVGLEALAERKTSTLSGGQLRRVGLAQVLAHDPEVLLLDEPTVGLDPAQRARFRELLAALPSERIVLVSTHQVDDLSDLFEKVVVLEAGVVRFEDSIAAFMDLAPDSSERRAEAAYARIVRGD